MKKCISFLFLLLLLYSCVNNDDKSSSIGQIIVVDVTAPSIENLIPINSFVDSVTFIPLETNEDCLIGRISKILFLEDMLIIQDARTPSIYVFNTQGEHLNTITRMGHGPGEYIRISHVMCNAKSNQIIVFDNQQSKMIFYDIYGNYIREVNNFSDGMLIRDVINHPNGDFICYCGDRFQSGEDLAGLWITDSMGVVKETLMVNSTEYPVRVNEDYAYLYPIGVGEVGISPEYGDEIFHLKNDSLSLYLIHNVDGRGEQKKDLGDINRSRTYEKGNFVLTEWTGKSGAVFNTLYSKKSNETKTGYIQHSVKEIECLFGYFISTNNVEDLVTATYSNTVINEIKKSSSNQKTKDLLQQLTAGKTEDEILDMNPIIQILHLKK